MDEAENEVYDASNPKFPSASSAGFFDVRLRSSGPRHNAAATNRRLNSED